MTNALAELADKPVALLLALEERFVAKHERPREASRSTDRPAALAITLGTVRLLVPRAEVREVLDLPTLTRIPGAKPWLLGIANIRGELFPITDLAAFLGCESSTGSGGNRILLLNEPGTPAAFRVDEVAGFQWTPAGATGDESRQDCSNTLVQRFLLETFVQAEGAWQLISLRQLARDPMFVDAGR